MLARRVLLVCLSALILAAPAHAAPATRAAAADAYLDMLDDAQVPAGWTGDEQSCTVGTESAQSIAATLRTVNHLRDLAGLGPVTFAPALNHKALAAALMMRAAGQLSHFPGQDWPCYSSDGADGAQRSNLYLGTSGAAAMVGYVDDAGVDSLGHRRWVLDPQGYEWGTGSTGSTNALLVIGGEQSTAPVPEVVSWPPAGHVPWPLVFEAWSAAISTPGADLSRAAVAVTVDGQPRPVTGVEHLGTGYGTGDTLKWNVGLADGDRAAPRAVSVVISAAVNGSPRTFAYELTPFPVLAPLAPSISGERTRSEVTVRWDAATERGAPVTGYRVVGQGIDETRGPGAREVTVPYAAPGQALTVRVHALSRAGDAVSDPLTLAGPAGRAPAGMRIRSLRVKKRGLLVARLAITSLADGGKIRLKLGGRRHAAPVKGGRATFRIRLTRRQRASRRLAAVFRFPGSAEVAPAKLRRKL